MFGLPVILALLIGGNFLYTTRIRTSFCENKKAKKEGGLSPSAKATVYSGNHVLPHVPHHDSCCASLTPQLVQALPFSSAIQASSMYRSKCSCANRFQKRKAC